MAERDSSHRGYHPFTSGGTDTFEVFWEDARLNRDGSNGHGPKLVGEGWYWWPRFKGMEPDNDAKGPFETSREAYEA